MNRLLTAAVAASALWVAACSSGGGSTITPPPPTGNFTPASLSGTYAFVTSGEFATSTTAPTPFVRTGSFVADGTGHITGGVYDLVNAGGSGTTPSSPNPITGGSYTVNPNGRGTLTLNVNSGGTPGSINFGFVLTSGSSGTSPANSGLMMDETFNGSQASTGGGNFVLQNPAALQAGISTISGPYVFDFSGLDAAQPNPSPESLVGQFTATNTGVISTAFEDANDGFALSSGSIVAGPLAADPANMTTSGRGTTTIAGQSYVFYIVDSSRVRFISVNASAPGPMLTGDAVSQSGSLPAGPTAINASFAFLVAGASANGGLIRVGRFTVTNGALSKILMDVNNAGVEAQVNNLSSGSISSFDSATGRGTLSFSNATTTYSFVFYLSSPSDGVIQETTAPSGSATAVAVDDGSVITQSGSPFTASNISGNYAMNWSGLETTGGTGVQDEEDLLSQVAISNLSLSGTSDIFQFSSLTLFTDKGTGGQINFNGGDGTGDDGKRVSLTVNLSNASPIGMVVYIVSPQLAFFENSNNNGSQRIVAGILKAQQ
jgi:hypothetical protein